jgi:hypothetical protein
MHSTSSFERGAARAIQPWERPMQYELEVDNAMSFAIPQTTADPSARRAGGGVEVHVTNEQSFVGTNDATMEWVSAV